MSDIVTRISLLAALAKTSPEAAAKLDEIELLLNKKTTATEPVVTNPFAAAIAQRFTELYGDKLDEIIAEHIRTVREGCSINPDKYKNIPEPERMRQGRAMFDLHHRNAGKSAQPASLAKLIYWLNGDWFFSGFPNWYEEVNTSAVRKNTELIAEMVIAVLPEQLLAQVRDMKLLSSNSTKEHFGLLFDSGRSDRIRRIITDTDLFEVRGMHGFDYLDMLENGKLVARSMCGEMKYGSCKTRNRAFFDGERLMTLPGFSSCAASTKQIFGGYCVDSWYGKIINGWHFYHQPTLSGPQDPLGNLDYAKLKVQGDEVVLDGEVVKPQAVFLPSRKTLLENGFTLYDWSEYHQIAKK